MGLTRIPNSHYRSIVLYCFHFLNIFLEVKAQLYRGSMHVVVIKAVLVLLEAVSNRLQFVAYAVVRRTQCAQADTFHNDLIIT